MKTIKPWLGVILIPLIGFIGCSRNGAGEASKIPPVSHESFQLPAVRGGNTNFKEIEKSFRDYCSSRYQSVSIESIQLACSAEEVSHQVDDRVDPSQAETLQGVATAIRYNRFARHGTISDGFNLNWIVQVSVADMVARTKASQGPLEVKWLSPDPTDATRLPVLPNDDIATLALTKYGISLSHITRMQPSGEEWYADGYVGTNHFELHVPDICEALAPANQFLSGSAISELSWNSNFVFGSSSSGTLRSTNNPVLGSPEIRVLCDWVESCIPKMIESENPQPTEAVVSVFLDFTSGPANRVSTIINSYPAILIGTALKPLLVNPTSNRLGKYKIKGKSFIYNHIQYVVVESYSKASDKD